MWFPKEIAWFLTDSDANVWTSMCFPETVNNNWKVVGFLLETGSDIRNKHALK